MRFSPVPTALTIVSSFLLTVSLDAQDFNKQVIYEILTGRFVDGDSTNNNPSQSPGLYDATKTNWQTY